MTEVQKVSAGKAKAKSSRNWPMLIVVAVGLAFIVGVWVNAYRVSHATPTPAPVTTKK